MKFTDSHAPDAFGPSEYAGGAIFMSAVLETRIEAQQNRTSPTIHLRCWSFDLYTVAKRILVYIAEGIIQLYKNACKGRDLCLYYAN